MIRSRKMLSCCFAAILAFSMSSGAGFASPLQTAPPNQTTVSAKMAHKGAATSAATPAQIADAKAKGLVWVNTETRVYHTGGRYYGKTKHGQFMTLSDAQKADYKPAKR